MEFTEPIEPLEPILYVDDEILNLKLFELNLRNHFVIYTASSANDGMKILKDKKIKVVVSDERMPVKSGIEFLEEASILYPNIARILLTAYTNTNTLVDSINKGKIFQFITKPWEPRNLATAIKNAIEIYNLSEQNQNLIDDLKKKNDELEKINSKLLEENTNRKNAEKALQVSENKFRNLFNSSGDLHIIINFSNDILEINFAFEDLLKSKKKVVIGKKIDAFIYPDDITFFNQKVSVLQEGEIISFFEFNLITNGDEIIPVEVNCRIIDYENEKAILIIARNIKERKEVEKKLLNAIIETEEKERQHFAEEIHDGLGPLISSMKFNLYILKEHQTGVKANKAIENLFELVNESSINIKEISNQLSPYVLKDYGLLAALKSFCNKIKSNDTKEINIYEDINDVKFNERDEVVLYRVITELINNTYKYAEATRIDISFSIENKVLIIHYKDDGKGFNINNIKETGKIGYGLVNIGNRLKSIGCKFEIITEENKGFVFNMKLKLQDK